MNITKYLHTKMCEIKKNNFFKIIIIYIILILIIEFFHSVLCYTSFDRALLIIYYNCTNVIELNSARLTKVSIRHGNPFDNCFHPRRFRINRGETVAAACRAIKRPRVHTFRGVEYTGWKN